MLVYAVPFVIFQFCFFTKIGKEVSFHFVLVKKSKFFIDDCLYSDTTNGFSLTQHFIVEITFNFIFRTSIDINAKILPAAHFHCVRIANGWIIVQVERNSAVTDNSLSQCYVSTCKCHKINVFG